MRAFFHRIVLLLVLLCLMQGRSMAQQHPGDVQWSRLTNPSLGLDTIHSVKVQTDGKPVVAGNSYDTSSYRKVIAVGRYVGAILDYSFGNNGIVTTALDSMHTSANAVEIQPDGKIVVAGSYQKDTAIGGFILVRYNTDGTPDSSFGVNGIVQTDIDSGSLDVATSLAIQPDGKLVAAGWSVQPGQTLAMCRYNTDGSLDSSFDSDGKLVVGYGGANSIVLQANGKMVVCCGSVIVRLNPDGSVDASFGTNGVALLNYNFYGMALQNDGKILLAGGGGFGVQRLDTTGALDVSFGSGGTTGATRFIYGASRSGEGAQWVCVQADGRILAGGWAVFGMLGDRRNFAIARFTTNGTLDGSFGGSAIYGMAGKAVLYPVSNDDYAATSFTAAITNNNELIVAGMEIEDGLAGFGDAKWVLASFYLGAPLGIQTVPDSDGQITIAPNPSSGIITFSSPTAIRHIEVTDLTGKVVYRAEPGSVQTEINLGGKAAGVYFYEVECGAGKQRGKLVKE